VPSDENGGIHWRASFGVVRSEWQISNIEQGMLNDEGKQFLSFEVRYSLFDIRYFQFTTHHPPVTKSYWQSWRLSTKWL
jgi:hypothetical protein